MLAALILCAAVPVIDVLGTRPESVETEHAGQGEVIRPSDPTRFNTAAQLSQNSALAVPETGQINAAGFAVPRIRGQDTRLTEVYVGDLLLQDPFSGLPLVDELDLRAFGELALYQGVAPPELATVSTVGVVQYRLLPFRGPGASAGGSVGRPYGAAGWALGAGGDKNLNARLYARAHRTDGRYRYYDDRATPYNTSDDRYAVRANNDRASQSVMPSLRYRDGANEVSVLSLWEHTDAGLPSDFAPVPSAARADGRSGLTTARYVRALTPALGAGLELGLTDDHRTLADPQRLFLTSAAQDFRVRSRRADLRLTWSDAALSALVDVGTAHAEATENARTLTRTAETAYGGAGWRVVPELLVEAKAGGRAHSDRRPAATGGYAYDEEEFARRRQAAGGGSLAVAYDWRDFRPYLQWGREQRLPSLLEELGDGATVRPAKDLRPERARHAEAGASYVWRAAAARFGLAGFEDDATDRITLEPAIGQSLRAQNVGVTRVRGGTVNINLFTDGPTRPSASFTVLEALDLTSKAAPLKLPSVPERQAFFGLEQAVGPLVARWASRYRSAVFFDPRNTQTIPGYWLHDLALDGAARVGAHALKAGLAVNNVTDLTRTGLAADGTGARGETGLEDVAGYPLPGRQWRVEVSWEM